MPIPSTANTPVTCSAPAATAPPVCRFDVVDLKADRAVSGARRHTAPILVAYQQQVWPCLLPRQRHDVLEEIGFVERLHDFEPESVLPKAQRGLHVRHIELEEGEADRQRRSPGVLAGAAGFEPANAGTKNRCLTTWRRPSRGAPIYRRLRQWEGALGQLCMQGTFNRVDVAGSGIAHRRLLR